MKVINLSRYSILLSLLVLIQMEMKAQFLDAHTQKVGESYVFFSHVKQYNFFKPIYYSPNFTEVNTSSITNSYQGGGGMRIWKSYFIRFHLTYQKYRSYVIEDGVNHNGNVHQFINPHIGIERYFSLLNDKVFLGLSPNLSIIRMEAGEGLSIFSAYNRKYENKNLFSLGVNFRLNLEYAFYRRYVIGAFMEGTHYFSDYIYRETYYSHNPSTNQDIYFFQKEVRPYMFNWGITLKMGLEHSSWYKKKQK